MGNQQLGRVGGEGGAFLFRRQHFQTVFDGKDGQQVPRRFGVGFRMPQEILQQQLQRNMQRRYHRVLNVILRRVPVGEQENQIGDDDVGGGQIDIFRNFFLLQQLRQLAFPDDDR